MLLKKFFTGFNIKLNENDVLPPKYDYYYSLHYILHTKLAAEMNARTFFELTGAAIGVSRHRMSQVTYLKKGNMDRYDLKGKKLYELSVFLNIDVRYLFSANLYTKNRQ